MKLSEDFCELLFKNSKCPDGCVFHLPKYPRWAVVAIKNSYPLLNPRRGVRVVLPSSCSLFKIVLNLVVYSHLKGII